MDSLESLTISDIRKGLHEKLFSASDLVERCLARIEESDTRINAFVSLFRESALAHAKEVDKKIASGESLSGLEGIPYALKDNILAEGELCTASSKMLKTYRAPYDATVVRALKEEGAILLGKTNLDEFAMGSSTENSAFGVTRNPHDPERVAGGSSGGSAAAVTSSMVPFALGSDTGGSIRLPASFCGAVGMKPTYGAVSRYGLITFGSSLDQIGPLTRTVEDAEAVFSVIRGRDPRDATSAEGKKIHAPSKIRLGLPKEYFSPHLDPRMRELIEAHVREAESAGMEIKEISLPNTEYALPCYYIIAPAEASSNLARYDGVRYGTSRESSSLQRSYVETRGEGFGDEVRRRILLGTYVLSAGYHEQYYEKAQKVRSVVKEDFMRAFEDVDAVLTPTSNTPAFKIGERMQDPLQMYLTDVYTIAPNLAGIPALSVPCGTIGKLPAGLQLITAPFHEPVLFDIAKRFESFPKHHV